jgi:hypothetical protein
MKIEPTISDIIKQIRESEDEPHTKNPKEETTNKGVTHDNNTTINSNGN